MCSLTLFNKLIFYDITSEFDSDYVSFFTKVMKRNTRVILACSVACYRIILFDIFYLYRSITDEGESKSESYRCNYDAILTEKVVK